MKAPSIEDGLEKNGGIGPGFDLLRLGLAIAILFVHCFSVATGSGNVIGPNHSDAVVMAASSQAADTYSVFSWLKDIFLRKHNPDGHFANVLVPMFFALSGFLVSGSAFRTRSLPTFLAFRAFRIVPALLIEVTLSALILGPLLTTFPLRQYFSDPLFVSYFGNIVGRVQFGLPGLFLSNPAHGVVNGNLWTLPAEFYCYFIIAILLVTGLLFKRKGFSIFFLFAFGGFVLFDSSFRHLDTSGFLVIGIQAVAFFFCGALIFQWREAIPLNRGLFLLSLLGVYLNIAGTPEMHLVLNYANLFLLSYVTVYIGFVRFPNIRILQSGDYSYGIYLYGYPISQTLIFLFQPLWGHPIYLALASLPATFAFAAASWHFLEKPALGLKRLVSRKVVRTESVSQLR